MRAKELRKFLETLSEDADIYVSMVAADGSPESLCIESVMLSGPLPMPNPPLKSEGYSLVYLCTWKPVFATDKMTPAEAIEARSRRNRLKKTRTPNKGGN